jgi:Spy/CpxP family protein refolding chaperone
MNLTDDQKKQLTNAEKETADKLAKVLTADQKKQFEEKPLGFGELPPAGQLLSSAVQDRLKLSDEQKKQTADLQKAVDEKLAEILKEDQKKQLKRMQDMAKGFPAAPPGGPPAFGGPPKLGQILPAFLQGVLNLTPEQKEQLTAAEKETAAKLAKALTDDQKKQFEEKPLGFDELPPAGQLLSSAVQARLKLTDEQKKQADDVQKSADEKLGAILKDDQKKQLKQMADMAKGFAAAPPGGFPGGAPGGLPGFGPPGGFPGFGPPGGAGLFRAPRYAADFPGLKDKELKPGKTIEELQQSPPK